MLYLTPILNGMILSLGLIIPLGPQNSFIIMQGMYHDNFKSALPTILTASVSDTLLICCAIFGVSSFMSSYPNMELILFGFGIIFIAYVAWTSWHATPMNFGDAEHAADLWSPKRQIAYALSVSLLNPYAYVDAVAVIGPSSLGYENIYKIVFMLACIVASWSWFFCLGRLGAGLQRYEIIRRNIGKISAILMLVCTGILLQRFINLAQQLYFS